MAVKRLTPKPKQAQPFRHTILTTLAVAAVLLIAAVPYVRLRLQVWQYAVDPDEGKVLHTFTGSCWHCRVLAPNSKACARVLPGPDSRCVY